MLKDITGAPSRLEESKGELVARLDRIIASLEALNRGAAGPITLPQPLL